MFRVQHLGALELADPGSANMRERHLAQILRHLRRHGPSSRARIAAECGLGVSTLSELIGELRGRSLVSESEPVRTQSAGRPLREVRLDAGEWVVGGLHLDEEGILAKLATLDGQQVGRFAHPLALTSTGAGTRSVAGTAAGTSEPATPIEALQQALPEVLGRMIDTLPSGGELVALEVGLPGAIRRGDGRVLLSHSLDLHDYPMGDQIRDTLASVSGRRIAVGIDNDCNFAALAARDLDGPGPLDRISVYIGGSRGIGGTLVFRDEVLRGSHGAAGEFGHWTIDQDDTPCWCGRRGCLATRAELSTLLVQSGLLSRDAAEQLIAGKPRDAVALLIAAAESGDPAVLAALTAAGAGLGSVIDAIHAMVNPDQVLIGGFLGALGPYLEDGIRSRFGVGESMAPKALVQIRVLDESVDAVVDGALASGRDICLGYPLHFGRGTSLPS